MQIAVARAFQNFAGAWDEIFGRMFGNYYTQPYNNITQTIARLEKERAARFFEPANLDRVGRRAGYMNFVSDLQVMTQNPQLFSERQKRRMLQFISDAYNDHIGAPRTVVKFYNGPKHQQGYFNHGNSIYINRLSDDFINDFAQLVNTVVHENTHNAQANPNVYSDPRLSRIYRANFQNYKTAAAHGYDAYRRQPVEVGASAAGNIAEYMLRNLSFANDNAMRPSMGGYSRPWQLVA